MSVSGDVATPTQQPSSGWHLENAVAWGPFGAALALAADFVVWVIWPTLGWSPFWFAVGEILAPVAVTVVLAFGAPEWGSRWSLDQWSRSRSDVY